MSRLSGRNRLLLVVTPILATIVVIAVVFAHPSSTPPAASASTPTPAGLTAPPIGDVTCDPTKHTDAKSSVHLTILINGLARDIPPTVGISDAQVVFPSGRPVVAKAGCYYWVHTGQDDGVIHANAPGSAHRTFILGDFFDVWHQPLGTDTVGRDHGPLHVYLNGRPYSGNPRDIPLTNHAVIQLDVGQDTAPTPYVFPSGQ